MEISPESYLSNIVVNGISYLIKDDNSNPMGYLSVFFEENGSYLYLANLLIGEEYRNKGIGTKAINWLIEFGEKFGAKKIYLIVDFDNERAQHIYKKAGFKFLDYISGYCYKMEYNYDKNK